MGAGAGADAVSRNRGKKGRATQVPSGEGRVVYGRPPGSGVGLVQRVGRILADGVYRHCLEQNAAREVDRPFCHHDFQHMLDVARICYILMVEGNRSKEFIKRHRLNTHQAAKEVIYAAGLLHNIGRWQQYDNGEDHASAGARYARPVLERAGFCPHEIEVITRAIASHRHGGPEGGLLGRLLCRADDLARPCATCAARDNYYKVERMETREMLIY